MSNGVGLQVEIAPNKKGDGSRDTAIIAATVTLVTICIIIGNQDFVATMLQHSRTHLAAVPTTSCPSLVFLTTLLSGVHRQIK